LFTIGGFQRCLIIQISNKIFDELTKKTNEDLEIIRFVLEMILNEM